MAIACQLSVLWVLVNEFNKWNYQYYDKFKTKIAKLIMVLFLS